MTTEIKTETKEKENTEEDYIKDNEDYFSYKDDVSIDSDALDVEILRQPQLFVQYAERCAKAEYILDKRRDKLELIKAKLDLEIRKSPDNFIEDSEEDNTKTTKKKETKKLTEAQILSIIVSNEEYREALDKYNSAKYIVKRLVVAVKAFEQKKASLENLVEYLLIKILF